MPDLVFTTKGVAQVIAERERISQQTAREKAAVKELSAQYAANEKQIKEFGKSLDQLFTKNASALQKQNKVVEESGRQQKKLQGEFELSGNKLFKAFSPDQLAKYALGFVGIGKAVQTVTQYLTDMEAKAQEAAERTLGSIGSLGELQQVSTSQQDFGKLVGQSRSMLSRGVFPKDQLGSAADFVFALRNAGYSDDEVEFITQLGESKQVKPENLKTVAEGLKKYQNIFGAGEAGSVRQVSQKVFAAAGFMQTDFAKAAEASTLYGSEAAALKYSDEEALAAFMAIEQRSPGAEEAATRLRGLLTSISKDGLDKGSLSSTLASLAERVRKGESAYSITGEIRAAAGLNILASKEGYATYQAQVAALSAAQGQDLIGNANYLNSDPQLAAARVKQAAEGALNIGRESRSSRLENLFDAYTAEKVDSLEKQGRYKEAYLERGALYLSDVTGGERGVLGNAASSSGSGISPELMQAIRQYFIDTAGSPEQRSALESRFKQLDDTANRQLKEQQETNRLLRRQGPSRTIPIGAG